MQEKFPKRVFPQRKETVVISRQGAKTFGGAFQENVSVVLQNKQDSSYEGKDVFDQQDFLKKIYACPIVNLAQLN